MMLIRAITAGDGLVSLKFPFHREVVDILKAIPGFKWNASQKQWETTKHGLAALRSCLVGSNLARLDEFQHPPKPPPPMLWQASQKLRDYQVVGAQQLLLNPGFMLTMEMRTGKTKTLITAAASEIAVSVAHRVIVSYPNQAKHEWINQCKEHINLDVDTIAGRTPLNPVELQTLVKKPWNVIGIHHEILGDHADDLKAIADAGPFGLIVDEVHMIKNRKAPRTKVLLDLAKHKNARFRWLSTGTPLRNRPEDMWTAWEMMDPGCMGSFWQYALRYCAAFENDLGFWDTKGASNELELAERLRAVSFRVTRQQVAQQLPKADRATILVDLTGKAAAQYRAQERAVAGQIDSVLQDGYVSPAALKALEALAQIAMPSKVNVVVERLRYHCEERKVKVVVFANFHDSLKQVWDRLEPEPDDDGKQPPAPLGQLPIYCAGGWILPEKRRKLIEEWKACQGPAVLLANTMSSGTGIDLADADGGIFVELAWVPSDVMQAEARFEDVHLGKRTTPPFLEFLLARNTVDQDMALALLDKLQNIDAVVGKNLASTGIASAIKDTGLVDRGALRLDRTDPDAAMNAMARLRERLLGNVPIDADAHARSELAATISENLEDDEPEEDNAA